MRPGTHRPHRPDRHAVDEKGKSLYYYPQAPMASDRTVSLGCSLLTDIHVGENGTFSASGTTVWTLSIDQLLADMFIGVTDVERTEPRKIVINLQLGFDGSRASISDELIDTIDYKTVRDRVLSAVQGKTFHLLESVAGRMVSVVSEDARVQWIHVEVSKPNGLRLAQTVRVTASWHRARSED